jgi:hypothetical protein
VSECSLAVAIHDRGFVDAPLDAVYGIVRVPDRYGDWWPRVTNRPGGEGIPHLVLAGFGKLEVVVERDRPPDSFVLGIRNDRAEGTLEWFLQPMTGGTLVNVLLGLRSARGWNRRRELAYRSAVRDALVALKRSLEGDPTREAPGEARGGAG